MELALPHVVVRICGPVIGLDLVAALSVHPVEVSEARDLGDMHRASAGRPVHLVVLTDPTDAQQLVAETGGDFPGVPILIVSDSAQPLTPSGIAGTGWVDTVHSGQPVQDMCWLVLEAVSRAAHLPGIAEHPLGPHRIEIDEKGIVFAVSLTPDVAIAAFLRLRPGDSLLTIAEPTERPLLAQAIARAQAGETQFCAVRLLDPSGGLQAVHLGLRGIENGRIAVVAQPLIFGGPIVGRHVNDRDSLTGLLTRWAMSRRLEARERTSAAGEATIIYLTLDDFVAASDYIGHRETDAVLLDVAALLNQVFPHPALTSRFLGDTFVASMTTSDHDEPLRRAERLLQGLGRIEVPGFASRYHLQGSVGVASVTDGDHDLALRLAEAAAGEARAAGGNRAIVAGSAQFTSARSRQLTASMDLGSWEVWLQPVVRPGNGRAEFHEALSRFDTGGRHLASRADFFIAGKAHGLLERFDRMMLQRALELLPSHPDARLSVNVAYETFVSKTFPDSHLELIQRVPGGCGRIILEIAPRCVATSDDVVRPRLDRLAAAGVAVALDDFGSGICRLRYLTQWPLAIVKLDQLVTGYVDNDPLQREFIRTVVRLCRARGITTVAEYTRSEEQLGRLVEDGVDMFQGELFGMPRPAAETFAAPAVAAAGA